MMMKMMMKVIRKTLYLIKEMICCCSLSCLFCSDLSSFTGCVKGCGLITFSSTTDEHGDILATAIVKLKAL
jgi:hypothetical protein